MLPENLATGNIKYPLSFGVRGRAPHTPSGQLVPKWALLLRLGRLLFRLGNLLLPALPVVRQLYLLALHYRASGQEAEALATARRVADHTPKIESAQTRKMQEEMRGLLAAARSGPLSETQEP